MIGNFWQCEGQCNHNISIPFDTDIAIWLTSNMLIAHKQNNFVVNILLYGLMFNMLNDIHLIVQCIYNWAIKYDSVEPSQQQDTLTSVNWHPSYPHDN